MTELTAVAGVLLVMICPESDVAEAACIDADCADADSVESVLHAVRLSTVVQIEMSNIDGRNNAGEIEEVVICYP